MKPSPEPLVTTISKNDLGMSAAYQQASATLSDFIAHLLINDGRFCSVKLCFRDPEESERLGEDRLLYWWLDFASYDPDEKLFCAEFTELPSCLEPYHQIGQQLLIGPEDIFDWRVNHDGVLYGGFTLRVARDRLPPEELAGHDQYIGVSRYSQTTAP